MRLCRWIFVLITGANLSSCGHKEEPVQSAKPVVLDVLFAFDDPANCIPGSRLQRLLDTMVRVQDAGRPVRPGVLDVPSAFRKAVGLPHLVRGPRDFPTTSYKDAIGADYEFSVPLRGTWLGLPVQEIRRDFIMGSDVGGFTVAFAATAEQVSGRLAAAGFKPPNVGKPRFTDTDFGGSMNLNAVPSGVELSC